MEIVNLSSLNKMENSLSFCRIKASTKCDYFLDMWVNISFRKIWGGTTPMGLQTMVRSALRQTLGNSGFCLEALLLFQRNLLLQMMPLGYPSLSCSGMRSLSFSYPFVHYILTFTSCYAVVSAWIWQFQRMDKVTYLCYACSPKSLRWLVIFIINPIVVTFITTTIKCYCCFVYMLHKFFRDCFKECVFQWILDLKAVWCD